MSIIELNEAERSWVLDVARQRQEMADRQGHRPAYGASNNRKKAFQMAAEGAIGELAIAKHLGKEWVPATPFTSDIVQTGDEVRFTSHVHGGLILHPKDPDDTLSWLVTKTGIKYQYAVRGSLMGADGKQDRFWREDIRFPCYIVPQRYLNPVI